MYFQTKPIYYIKTFREEKKIFYLANNDFREPGWILDENIENDLTGKKLINPSYNCFILTKDKKLILGTRSYSFYCSYIHYVLKNPNKKIHMGKIINCVKNLEISEFVSLMYVLDKKKIINIKDHLTSTQLKYISSHINIGFCNIFYECDFNKIKKDTLEYTLFKIKITKIISSFVQLQFECSKTVAHADINPILSYTLILPGGKMMPNENTYDIISREINEELGIQLNESNTMFLNRDLVFERFTKFSDIIPIFYTYTNDKILKYNYSDKVFVLYIDYNSSDIISHFKTNHEIKNIFSINLNFDKNNIEVKTLINILKKYKESF